MMNEMEIPVSAIRGYIENAIDIVVQIDRMGDGKRKVSSISEVNGIRDGRVNISEIFGFRENGLTDEGDVVGEFIVSDNIPYVYDKIKRKGITSVDYIFERQG